jgi:hypothetical protein
VMFIETLAAQAAPKLKAMAVAAGAGSSTVSGPPVSDEFAQARFGGLRRR